jgi:hypothetical protein
MTDKLTRRRLNANIVDQFEDVSRRLALLERNAVTAAVETVRVGVLGLAVLEYAPAPPPAGVVYLFAQKDGGTITLRAIDAGGVVKTLESWV